MIRYYEGIEGSFKTCMMTKDLYLHYVSGGRVLAFPGYELYGDTKRQVLSELMLPEQIFDLISSPKTEIIRKQRIAIAVDEIFNFINHHNWYAKLCDILSAVLQQRRKINTVFLMTGPSFFKLPPDVRDMVHEIVHCVNARAFNRAIPRDLMCKYYKEDRRGMLSNYYNHFSFRKRFYGAKWFKHFDTYASVGFQGNITMKIANRIVTYDNQGNLLDDGFGESQLPKYIDDEIKIASKLEELKNNAIEIITPSEFAILLQELGFKNSPSIRAKFASRGFYYDTHVQGYRIRDTQTVLI